ncbi:HAD family hydrolase [Lactiplantibacillus modestisalitolerans]|uniref:HAD family hydrolase n=1 Tax=Lactiplantibacillus modestisalitolerans TaxID=1457219 RepID=A0ABV5WTM3_9LACO|nr:HAD family hydrolase [Lactiplantibacillus modestisalitolerans]
MTYQTILFDVDNTLLDSASLAATALHEATAKFGYEVSEATARTLVGVPTDKALASQNVPANPELIADFNARLTASKDQLRFFDGIPELLQALVAANITIGVVTSRTRAQIAGDLGAFPEITGQPILVNADDTTEHKPSGAPLEYALKHYQLDPATAMYVGDTIYDMQSALNAKIDFASASWGALPTTDFSKATYQPQTPSDLLKLII